jgi:uncharacterized protein (TIGR00266 family)
MNFIRNFNRKLINQKFFIIIPRFFSENRMPSKKLLFKSKKQDSNYSNYRTNTLNQSQHSLVRNNEVPEPMVFEEFTVYFDHPKIDVIRNDNPDYSRSRPNEELIYTIEGLENQLAVIDIYPGKVVKSETAKLVYFTEGIDISTSSGGGFFSGITRLFTGSSFFITEYKYKYDRGFGRIAFAEPYPSKMIPIRFIDYPEGIICQKGAFVCGTTDVQIEISYTNKITTGLFGGEGFVLQKLSGTGSCILKAGGTLIKRSLRHNEKIKITPGIIVYFSPSVKYNIEYVGNVRNIFGAGSLFYASLTGPGDVFLQTMSFDKLVEEIQYRLPSRSSRSSSSSISSSSHSSENTDQNSDKNNEAEVGSQSKEINEIKTSEISEKAEEEEYSNTPKGFFEEEEE